MDPRQTGDLRRRDQDELRTEWFSQRRKSCRIHWLSILRVAALAGIPLKSDAGERTRTSTDFRPPGPKPGASTSSATPARFKDRAAGYARRMATPEDRERESRESDVTKYEELTEEVREEQHKAAERIAEPLEPQEDDES